MAERVVIIGAGHAGGAAAISLRDLGFSGSICVIGDEKLHPYERPSLSKDYLSGQDSEPVWLATEDRWELLDVEFRLGAAAVGIDRERAVVVLADGSELGFDHLILAMGGKVRRLPSPHIPSVHYLRTTQDAEGLKAAAATARRALVIGGGVIGLEAASTLKDLGLETIVLEAGDRILSRNIPEEAAGWLSDAHAKKGIEIRSKAQLSTLIPNEDGSVMAELMDGSHIETDLVVVGIGIIPCIDLPQTMGLTVDGGVVVDPAYRSIDDDRIYAIGDLAVRADRGGRMETWAHAQSSARAAAVAIMGQETEREPAPWFWTAQCGHNLQILGDPSSADKVIAPREGVRLYARNGIVVGAICLDQPREFASARRQLGKPLPAEAAPIRQAVRELVAA